VLVFLLQIMKKGCHSKDGKIISIDNPSNLTFWKRIIVNFWDQYCTALTLCLFQVLVQLRTLLLPRSTPRSASRSLSSSAGTDSTQEATLETKMEKN
jgi:hypothetical protein